MKKVLTIITVFIVLATCACGCSCTSVKPTGELQSVTEIAKLKSSGITKIIFYDQSVGMKPFPVDNKKKIDEFIESLDQCKIERKTTPRDSVGWMQQAVFYSNDDKISVITFGNPIVIDGVDYNVIENCFGSYEIDLFLKTIDSSWKKNNE